MSFTIGGESLGYVRLERRFGLSGQCLSGHQYLTRKYYDWLVKSYFYIIFKGDHKVHLLLINPVNPPIIASHDPPFTLFAVGD